MPGLATVLVGDDPASHVYVGNKRKQTEEVGMRSIHHGLDASTSQDELLALIAELERRRRRRRDPGPASAARRQIDQDAVIAAIDPAKDVDGLTAGSAGLLAQGRPGLVPCTPQGVMELLRHAGVEVRGGRGGGRRALDPGRPAAARACC